MSIKGPPVLPSEFTQMVNKTLMKYRNYPFNEAMEQVYALCFRYFPMTEPSGRFVMACWKKHKDYDYGMEPYDGEDETPDDELEEWEK
jgi:hypothetical protein